MKYFPAFLDLRGKLCVVAGGGRVAERKIRSLLRAGASVKVIGPELTKPLLRLKLDGKIVHRARLFRPRDLQGAVLTFAATDDRATNERVSRQAFKMKIPVNVVDAPALSSFIVPSLVERGDLLLAISTSGQSPALARLLRRKLQKEMGPEYSSLLKFLGALRRRILTFGWGQKRNQEVFRKLAREDLLHLIRKNDRRGLEARLRSILGPEFSVKELR
jgi:precorrin-2 dehydrogenase/sirohydrochlorin ferrochelatase